MGAKRAHYSRSPIVEAIIDIRHTLPAPIGVDELDDAFRPLRDRYPRRRRVNTFHGNVIAGDEVGITTRQAHTGYQYFAGDEQKNIRLTTDGFGFSWLKPYDRWEVFRQEARTVWDEVSTSVPPESLTRLAVRYINRVSLPSTRVELKDYFRTGPELSPDLPLALSSFLCHLEMPLLEQRAEVHINVASLEPNTADSTSQTILLDIDIFRTADIPQDAEAAWEVIDDLHAQADRVFEASITDRTRELIG